MTCQKIKDGFNNAWTNVAYYCNRGLFIPINKWTCKLRKAVKYEKSN